MPVDQVNIKLNVLAQKGDGGLRNLRTAAKVANDEVRQLNSSLRNISSTDRHIARLRSGYHALRTEVKALTADVKRLQAENAKLSVKGGRAGGGGGIGISPSLLRGGAAGIATSHAWQLGQSIGKAISQFRQHGLPGSLTSASEFLGFNQEARSRQDFMLTRAGGRLQSDIALGSQQSSLRMKEREFEQTGLARRLGRDERQGVISAAETNIQDLRSRAGGLFQRSMNEFNTLQELQKSANVGSEADRSANAAARLANIQRQAALTKEIKAANEEILAIEQTRLQVGRQMHEEGKQKIQGLRERFADLDPAQQRAITGIAKDIKEGKGVDEERMAFAKSTGLLNELISEKNQAASEKQFQAFLEVGLSASAEQKIKEMKDIGIDVTVAFDETKFAEMATAGIRQAFKNIRDILPATISTEAAAAASRLAATP